MQRVMCAMALLLHASESIFLPYWRGKNHTENSFHIPMDAMMVGNSNPKIGSRLESLLNTTQQYSLDERCLSGMPLSIAWHPYAPYVTMYQSKYNNKQGFSISGMFPGILTKVRL